MITRATAESKVDSSSELQDSYFPDPETALFERTLCLRVVVAFEK